MPVNDWIAAARAGARGLIDAHGVIRDSSPKYGETYRTNMNARASEQIAQLKAREKVLSAGIQANIIEKKSEQRADAIDKDADRKANSFRKAGYVGALGGAASGLLAGFMDKQDQKRQDERDAKRTAADEAQIQKLKDLIASTQANSTPTAPPKLIPIPPPPTPLSSAPATPTPATPAPVTSAPAAVEGGSDGSSPVSTGSGSVSRQAVYSYLTGHHKLSRNQALGIMANIDRESSFRIAPPGGDGGNSFGMLQWNNTYGRSDLMMKHVPDWRTNWRGQLDFALSQNQLPEYSDYITKFRNTTFNSPQAAADDFMNNWERPSDRIGGSRKHAGFLSTYNF